MLMDTVSKKTKENKTHYWTRVLRSTNTIYYFPSKENAKQIIYLFIYIHIFLLVLTL
jgi:hypothetical protein